MANQTLSQIQQLIIASNLTNEDLNEVIAAVKFARTKLGQAQIRSFNVGDRVTWTERNGGASYGIINKINQKKLVVVDERTSIHWRIPANMLSIA